MNRREIFDATMAHKEVGRVLVDQGKQVGSFHKKEYNKVRTVLGLPETDNFTILDRMNQCVISDEDVLQALGIDFRWLIPKWSQVEDVDAEHYRNLFGVLFRDMGDSYSEVEAPLREAGVEDIENHKWPRTDDREMFAGLKQQAEDWHKNTDYVIGADGIKGGVFQSARELRGMDQLFMDFVLNPEFVHALLAKVTQVYKELYTVYLQEVGEYIQILYLTDDFGSQNSLLMSPDMWETFLKPYEKELISHIKSIVPGVKVMFHTDGSVLPIIDGMIDMGVDILNPVQTSVEELMDTKALNEQYGDRICFHGAIDVQNVMVNASEDEVRQEVKRRICDLGKGGGYIISTCHQINHDIPAENVKAMFEAAHEFGEYPLKCD